MPYSYHESTHLSREDALAVKSLAATGELPNDHYWNAQRTQHVANPTRYDRANYVLAALLDRDQLQRQGTLSASAPLFSHTGFFSYAGAKHSLNSTRFDHWHPFLGRLFEITLPANPAGEGLTTTPTGPGVPATTPVTPISSGGTGTGGSGTGGSGTGGSGSSPNAPSMLLPPSSGTDYSPGGGGSVPLYSPGPPTPAASTPEPASAVMLGIALTLALAGMLFKRLVHRGHALRAQSLPA